MNIELIEGSIRSALADLSAVPADSDPNADLYLDLGLPSVQALALLQELEERFGLSIPDEQFVNATTIAKLTATLHELVNSNV